MATLLPPDSVRLLPHLANLHRFLFTVPSVLAESSSPRYALQVDHGTGILKQVRAVWPNATTVSLYLGAKDDNYRDTLNEVYRAENVTRMCNSCGILEVIFENTDTYTASTAGNPFLYVEVDNLGGSLTTGMISLEIIILAASSK